MKGFCGANKCDKYYYTRGGEDDVIKNCVGSCAILPADAVESDGLIKCEKELPVDMKMKFNYTHGAYQQMNDECNSTQIYNVIDRICTDHCPAG